LVDIGGGGGGGGDTTLVDIGGGGGGAGVTKLVDIGGVTKLVDIGGVTTLVGGGVTKLVGGGGGAESAVWIGGGCGANKDTLDDVDVDKLIKGEGVSFFFENKFFIPFTNPAIISYYNSKRYLCKRSTNSFNSHAIKCFYYISKDYYVRCHQ
jgi:hypothetical protein